MVYQIVEKNYIDSVKLIDIAEIAHEGNYDPHSYYSKNVLIQCRLRWLKTVSSSFQDVDFDGS